MLLAVVLVQAVHEVVHLSILVLAGLYGVRRRGPVGLLAPQQAELLRQSHRTDTATATAATRGNSPSGVPTPSSVWDFPLGSLRGLQHSVPRTKPKTFTKFENFLVCVFFSMD